MEKVFQDAVLQTPLIGRIFEKEESVLNPSLVKILSHAVTKGLTKLLSQDMAGRRSVLDRMQPMPVQSTIRMYQFGITELH